MVWLFTGSATLGTRAGEERDEGAKEGEGTVPFTFPTVGVTEAVVNGGRLSP